MKFHTDEKIDFINALLLAYGYWQKQHQLNTGRIWHGNAYQNRFESLMKSHQKHPFFPIFKSIADMNPPPQAFMQMILYFNNDCSSCIDGVSESDVIPPQLDTAMFTRAMADLRKKFAYSVVIEKTREERKSLENAADDFASIQAAKFIVESVFPQSAQTADPELVVSPLSSGNFTFNAGGKNYIIVSPEGAENGGWKFGAKQGLHVRYFQYKTEPQIQTDIATYMPLMKKNSRVYADKTYSIKSGLDDRGAIAATVRQALSAYVIAAETSNETAMLFLSRAMKRGLGLVSVAYNILKQSFAESPDGTFRPERFYSDLQAFIKKSF